jgi:DNA (cytosine-5)-methyltransferase 1
MIKIGTHFSGIGSPEAALRYLGLPHKSIFACEIDKYARASFNEMHHTESMVEDVTTSDWSSYEPLDLYVAGFPCQAFSTAGKRLGFNEARGTLFFNVAEFIKVNQPKAFILENVKGLVNHDAGKTFTTIIDILSNGGGTVNGQISIDNIDNGLGYHIYYKVLNTKDYGIPQNRERIFIVGFKDFRSFRFPKPIPLDIKLKDIIEDNVDNKYYLSDKMIAGFLRHNKRHIEEKGQTGFNWKPKDLKKNHVANCLRANAALAATDNSIITHSLYPISSKTGKGGSGHLSKSDGTSYCLDTGNAQAIEIKRLPDLKLKVSKRANDTPKEINQYLKDNKKGTIKEIAKKLNLPKTKVEHYFRVDKCRAIPSPEVWIKLKKLLGFCNKYDKQVTEINESIGTYESANRLYDTNGISPTLQTQEQGYYQTSNDIRRLTPLECFRLQGFKDEDFYKAQKVNSDTQLYKQAGNSITVDVMMALINKIYA